MYAYCARLRSGKVSRFLRGGCFFNKIYLDFLAFFCTWARAHSLRFTISLLWLLICSCVNNTNYKMGLSSFCLHFTRY